mgnify:CR=1 FL=1
MNLFRLKVCIESYASDENDNKTYEVFIVPSTTVRNLKETVCIDILYAKPSYFKIIVLDSEKDQYSR